MGNRQLKFIVLTVALVMAFAVPSSLFAQPVRITDYDVPISRSDRLDLSGSAWLSGDNRYGNYSHYEINADWESFYNSLPFAWHMQMITELNIRKSRKQAADYNEAAELHGSLQRYFTDRSLAFGGITTHAFWEPNYHHMHWWVGPSVGIGRFVEATPMAKALRIEEQLIKETILKIKLSRESVLALTEIIGREKEYRGKYGEVFWVEWYADMEQAIIADGGTDGNSIGALGHLRVSEIIERETIQPRSYGWRVEAGTGYYVSHAYGNRAYTWPNVTARFSHPLGLRAQLSFYGRAATSFSGPSDELMSLDLSLTLSYELSNRIDAILREEYVEDRKYKGIGNDYRIRESDNSLKIGFSFYLENHISVTLGAGLYHRNRYRYFRDGERVSESRSAMRQWKIDGIIGYRVF